MHSTIAILVFFTLTLLYSTIGIAEPFDGYFSPEKECNTVGGLCLHEDLCDPKEKYDAGCPSQRSNGAVCCSKLPSNETRCSKYGGNCVPKSNCGRNVASKATDCGTDNICCVLI